jgi:hypothetical protein
MVHRLRIPLDLLAPSSSDILLHIRSWTGSFILALHRSAL